MADFAIPTLTRAIGAAVFAAVVAVAVWAVETSAGEMRANDKPAIVPAAASLRAELPLMIESTYDVAAWAITVDGKSVSGTGDARHWRGTMSASARELAVEATPADVLAGGPAALRAVLATETPRTFTAWGDGAAALRVGL
jgi:hypothetical protein